MAYESLFYPEKLIARARANAARYPWAAAIQQEVVAAAAPWRGRSVHVGPVALELAAETEFVEVSFEGGGAPRVVSGEGRLVG